MSFHEEELVKIKNATSGFFKRSARMEIAASLRLLARKLEEILTLEEKVKQQELIKILSIYTTLRHLALETGANGYGHWEWASASASACELWVQEILFGDESSIKRVEAIVYELMERA